MSSGSASLGVIADEYRNFSNNYSSLENIRNNPFSYQILDSKALISKYEAILERLMNAAITEQKDSPVGRLLADIMKNVKVPKDAYGAALKLEALSQLSLGSNYQLVNSLRYELNQLAKLYDDFTSGAYARVIENRNGSSNATPYTSQIRAMAEGLRLQAIAATSDLSDLGEPKADEGLSSFIRRLAAEAFEKKDWQRLYTMLSRLKKNSTQGV
ncbi:MAG: hypothetical protein ACK5LK_03470 [Chthoniobacterales bacterium]